MSDYRRYFVSGGTYFFTLVTERRTPLFASATARWLLGRAMRDCLARFPLQVIAVVLLPDHLHALWALPDGDERYSMRWSWIKREFTRNYLANGGAEQPRNSARLKEGRRGVWQRRFWEHLIRDERDLESHFDYIHYNPVKHGLVSRPRDWRWSSFHRWMRAGQYSIDWASQPGDDAMPGNAGE